MQAWNAAGSRAAGTRHAAAHTRQAGPLPHRGKRHAGRDELVAQVVQVQRAARGAGRGVAGRAAARGGHEVAPQPAQVALLACREAAPTSAGKRVQLCRYASSDHSTWMLSGKAGPSPGVVT